MEPLNTVAVWLEEILLPYGGVGLMLLAVCDSSFLSFPEVNDILLMTFSIRSPDRMVVFAGLTTLGSVTGCSMLYSIGRGGGGAFLRRWISKGVSTEKLGRIHQWYERWGMLAVIVPSFLPPPTPFKIFVLSAGTFGISWPKFIAAVTLGRSIRYFSEALLAVWYGDAAIAFVEVHYPTIGIVLVVTFAVAALTALLWGRRGGADMA
jgi:membrane protein YqaA with SNARE-associated domain